MSDFPERRRMEREAAAIRLGIARRAAGLRSAREAAIANGWNVKTYTAHESGANSFNTAYARAYAEAFGCNLTWLVLGEDALGAVPPQCTPVDKTVTSAMATRPKSFSASAPLPVNASMKMRRYPNFWSDIEVREMAILLHRQTQIDEAREAISRAYGEGRTPSRSSLHRFWANLDGIKEGNS